jgi:peptidyl-prolyl cis-trans isomerase D
MLPDSVKARHILIQPSEKLPFPKARILADSIKHLLENGADFVTLAHQYSADKNSLAKDGDLGWYKQGHMIKEFEDSTFIANKGDIVTATTKFGIHIIEIEDKGQEVKKVKVATIVRNVEPTDATRQVYYAKASRFAGENNTADKFDAAVEKESLTKRIASNLKKMDKDIAGLENPREMIKWAYSAELGDVSPVFELGNKFVVAKLTKIVEKGPAPLEDVTNEIKVAVTKEIKGQKLSDKLLQVNAKSLEDYSNKLNLPLQNAEKVVFSAYTIPGVGIEPEVIATATTVKPNVMTKPVAGNNGVFILKVINTDTVGTITIESEQMKMKQDIGYRIDYQVYNALMKAANINDERSKFF